MYPLKVFTLFGAYCISWISLFKLYLNSMWKKFFKNRCIDSSHTFVVRNKPVAEMRSQCPAVATTRWISFCTILKWLVRKCSETRQYLNLRSLRKVSDEQWLIHLHSFNSILSSLDVSLKSSQGKRTKIMEQDDRLKMCSFEL